MAGGEERQPIRGHEGWHDCRHRIDVINACLSELNKIGRKLLFLGETRIIDWAVNYLLWVSCCIGAAYGLCSICVGVGVFLHNRICKEEVTRVTMIGNRTSGPSVPGTHRNTGAAWPRPPSASADGRNVAVCPAGPELPD